MAQSLPRSTTATQVGSQRCWVRPQKPKLQLSKLVGGPTRSLAKTHSKHCRYFPFGAPERRCATHVPMAGMRQSRRRILSQKFRSICIRLLQVAICGRNSNQPNDEIALEANKHHQKPLDTDLGALNIKTPKIIPSSPNSNCHFKTSLKSVNRCEKQIGGVGSGQLHHLRQQWPGPSDALPTSGLQGLSKGSRKPRPRSSRLGYICFYLFIYCIYLCIYLKWIIKDIKFI